MTPTKTVQLRSLKKGDYFKRLVRGKLTAETYTREEYDRETRKFGCAKHSDVWGDGILLKGSTLVNTDFTS